MSKQKRIQKKPNTSKNSKKGLWITLLFVAIAIVVTAFILSNNLNSKNNTKNQVAGSENGSIYGDDVVDMYYFHLLTCKYCHLQNAFMKNKLTLMYPQLRINWFELTEVASNKKLKEMAKLHPQININRVSTPTTIIGDEVNIGYSSDDTTGVRLIEMVEKEVARIERSWNPNTMKRTIDLRDAATQAKSAN